MGTSCSAKFNAGGLASVVEGRGSVADALRPTDVKGLQVLPGGLAGGRLRAALHSPALRQAMRRLSAAADFVVIDAPPALAGADNRRVGRSWWR